MSSDNLTSITNNPIFKTVSVYLVTAWLILQVAATVFPVFNLSNNWLKGLIGILLIGFLASLFIGWKKNRQKQTTRSYQKLSLALIAFLILGFGIGLGLLISRQGKTEKIAKELRDETLAALYFDNETGDESLDGLGSYLSLVLTESFAEQKDVKTVSANTVKENMKFAGYLPDNAEGKISFFEATGARLTVGGRIFPLNDSLLSIKSYLSDALTGEDIHFFEEVIGNINDKQTLARDLKEKILGYWVTQEDVTAGKYNAPKYEAFLAYEEYFYQYIHRFSGDAGKFIEKATSLDSTFNLALIYQASLYFETRRFEEGDSIFAILERRKGQLTPYEALTLKKEEAFPENDKQKHYDASMDLYKLYPKDPLAIFQAVYSYNTFDQHHKAVSVVENSDLQHFDFEHTGAQFFLREISTAYYFSGQFQKTVDVIERYLPKNGTLWSIWQYYIFALVELDQKGKIDELIADYEGKLGRNLPYSAIFARSAARKYFLMGDLELAKKYSEQSISIFNKTNSGQDRLLAELYFLNGQYVKARDLYQKRHNNAPYDPFRLSRLAICESKIVETNGRTKARAIIEQMIEMTKQELPKRNGLNKTIAGFYQSIAAIYAHLNETELALEYVEKSMEESNRAYRLRTDVFLAPLFEYEQFQEMVKPKE